MIEHFILSLFGICLVASLVEPILGVYLFFVVSYIRPQDFYPQLAQFSPALIVLIALFISAMIHGRRANKNKVFTAQGKALIGMFLIILIGRMKVIDSQAWLLGLENFMRIIFMYFMVVKFIDTPKKMRNFFVFFLLLNLFIAVRFYIAYKTGNAVYHGSKPGDASFGFLANADDLGIGMAMAFPFAFVPAFLTKNNILRCVLFLFSAVFALAILGAGSRAAQISMLIIGFISFLFCAGRISRSTKVIVIICFLMAGSAFIYNYRHTLRDTYDSSRQEDDPGRLGRQSTWGVGKQMIKHNPVLGVGINNYVPYWQNNYPSGIYGCQVAHNIILQVAAETGLFGLSFFLWFALSGVKDVLGILKKFKRELEARPIFLIIFITYLSSVLVFFLNGMFITVAFYWHIYVLTAMFVAAKSIFMREIAKDGVTPQEAARKKFAAYRFKKKECLGNG